MNSTHYNICSTQKSTPPLTGSRDGRPTCTFCGQPAEFDIKPALCALHLDWVVLINFMQRRNELVTPETVKIRLQDAMINGGNWTLTVDQVDDLFAQFFSNITITPDWLKEAE